MFKPALTILMIVSLSICINTGCTPRTIIKKNPGSKDCGVRYYRPKPYLMIKPAVDDGGKPVPGYVSIEVTTLPDYSEEYSIHIRPGMGSNNTQITLKDGWNLTNLNVDVDTQLDETLGAMADVISAVPTPTGGGRESAVTVRGINVPLGLYEAVISRDKCTKRLYGFRYIGFLPFSPCPLEMNGCHEYPCEAAPMYGLVFDQTENVMVFKPLLEIPHLEAKRSTPEKPQIMEDDPNDQLEDVEPAPTIDSSAR